MYTQCPECAVVFPVSADALSISNGNVRCGACGEVFFAVRSLSETLDEDGQIPTCFHSEHPPTLNDPNSEAPPIDDLFWPTPTPTPTPAPTPPTVIVTAEPSPSAPQDEELELAFDEMLGDSPLPKSDTEPSAATPSADEFDDFNPELEAEIPEAFIAAPAGASDNIEESADFDDTQYTENEPDIALSGVAFELAAARAARSRTRGTWLWGLWSGIAAMALLGQWFTGEHDQLARNPTLKPWVVRACQVFGCQIELPTDLAKIHLVNRSIEPHPSVEGALLISATLQNQADFPQPHPIVEIAMADLSGRAVAMRRFPPAHYLENPDPAGMMPGHLLPLVFEVIDPGRDAVAFEFEFR